ncbi:putative Ig domain-containing protein [Spirosoma rigui]|uniref:putative Ig domain-containing protein n=1 Tax=Spirosoma rigui TaxID=564064 RepID=UPI0009B0345F|nr:putative Ig domain-containing protein [Spirosoma rigui]
MYTYPSILVYLRTGFLNLLLLSLFLGTLLRNGPLLAQSLPSGFASSQLQNGYSTPVGAVFSSDGRQLFVWEKAGRVWVSNWNGSTYIRQSTPVIDISDEVGDWGDGGFLSACLDPGFSSNGLLYLFYVVDRHHLLYYNTPQYNRGLNEYDNSSINRVTRYRVTNTGGTLAADISSRQVLIGESRTTGIPMVFPSHVGGTILFGRDGTLLISTGDNAFYDGPDVGSHPNTYYQSAVNDGIMRPAENVGAMRSQMVGSLCGKVLRINPANGDGVSSNPFFDAANPRSPQSRVWALGLRNPYRMTIQPNTGSTNPGDGNPGTLLVGDVGWSSVEEFNVVDQAGLNFGWPLYEGMETRPGYYGRNVRNEDEAGRPTFESLCLQPTSPTVNGDRTRRRFTHARPTLDWLHNPDNARVPAFDGSNPIFRTIGTPGAPAGTPFSGYASIGGAYYTGSQFPAAYQNTYFFADFGQNWIRNLSLQGTQVQEVRTFAPSGFGQNIVDLEVNPLDGSLIYVSTTGQIVRISYGGNQPPIARLSGDVTSGSSPLRVRFTGANSSDPEGRPLRYRWDFGDGTSSEETNPEHVFSSGTERSFTVTLVVTDEAQQTASAQLTISLNSVAPTVQITSPTNGTLYPMDRASTYTLTANVTGSNLSYEWQLSLLHNTHEHPEPVIREVSPQIRIAPVGCSGMETYSYRISLKVTNPSGLSASSSVLLLPNCQLGSSTVSQLTASPQTNAVRVSWQNPALPFDEVMVAARAGTGFQDHPTGTSFTANPNYSGNGSPIEGGKVVYRGRAQEITVTGLNASTTYYFRVFTRIGDTWNGGVEVTARPNGGSTGGSFTLLPPLYNCATGAITFQTSGGDGTPIEYAASGITGWTTVATHTIDAGLRGDPKVIILNARQSGVQVSYSFNLPAACNPSTGNRPPVVNAPLANLSATVQQPFTFTIPATTFSDPDGQTLTLTLTGLPTGLGFDRNTATISGQPTTAGQATLTLTATDPGNLSVSTQFQLNVNPAGTTPPPPTSGFAITGATTVRCETVTPTLRQLTFTPQYSGLNGQPVTFSVIGELAATTSPGPYTIRVYVDNPALRLRAQQGGTAGEAAFTYNWLAVCNGGPTPPANQLPVVNASPGTQQAVVDQLFTYAIPGATFADPEGQPLTLTLTGLPTGLSFDRNTATISGRPTTAGQATLTLTATDPGNLSVSTQFQLNVSPAGTTPPPPTSGFAITGATTVRCETLTPTLRQLTFTPQYSGLNGQPVTFSVIGELAATTSPGPYTIRVYVDNPALRLRAQQGGTAGEAAFTYNWLAVCNGGPTPPANQLPVVNASPGTQQAVVDQLFTYAIPGATFADPEGQPLTLTLTGLPTGLSFDRNTATISGRPTTAGQATLTLTATDPGNLSVSTQFQLNVSPAGTTPPPPTSGFAITGATTVRCETLTPTLRQLTFTPQYSGLNGQPVTFSVIGELAATTSPGPYTIRVYVDNPALRLRAQQGGTAGEAAFTYNWLAVCNGGPTPPANQLPVVNASPGTQQAVVDQLFTYAIPGATFADPEGQPLTLTLTGLPTGLSFDRNTATISGRPTTAGQATLTLTATDPGNLSVSTQFQLNVSPAGTTPPPPTSGFAITGATTVRCETLTPTLRQLTFTPQYSGLNGQPVTFSVFGEMVPTTNPGPYTLRIYIDNPRISLRAEQSGVASSYTYNWLAACTGTNARLPVEAVERLTVQLLGNPVDSETASVDVRGAVGQRVGLQVLDGRGYVLSETTIEQAAPVERASVKLVGRGGLYFLRVSTANQSQLIKLVKP